MKVRFWHSDKPRERLLAEAFVTGVKRHGDEADMRALGTEFDPNCDVAVMAGVKSKDLWTKYARLGTQLCYLDKGYSRHSRPGDLRAWEYWRCAVNSHQPTLKFRPDYPRDRAEAAGWRFKPWRENGTDIIIAGSSGKYHSFYDMKDPTDFATKLVKALNNYTKRAIVYRPKPSWKEAVPIINTRFSREGEGIEDVLRNAHCLITHGSNACFEAMLAGVPSIVLGEAVAKPISSTGIEDVEHPRLASNTERQALLNFLAYQQWTMQEMIDGKAWEIIRRQIFE